MDSSKLLALSSDRAKSTQLNGYRTFAEASLDDWKVRQVPIKLWQRNMIVFVAIMRFVENSTSNINANDDVVLMAA